MEINEPGHSKIYKMSRSMTKPSKECAPSKDSDQRGHPPSLIRAFAVRCMGSQAVFMRTVKTLIRLGGCSGLSESLLGAQVILLVLSCCGSNGLHLAKTQVSLHINTLTVGPRHGKICLCPMRTTKVQISLRIHAV